MRFTNKTILATVLGLFAIGAAIAQTDSSLLFEIATSESAPSLSERGTSGLTLGLAGDHEFGYRLPAYDGSSFDHDGEMKSPYFSSELDLTIQENDLKLVSNWSATGRPLTKDSMTGEYGGWDDLVTLRPLENYLSWSPKGFKISAGYQIFSWGVADRRNPTDNLNPRDYSVGIDADRVPVLAMDVIWYPLDTLSIEGVFLPTAQRSIFPVDFKSLADDGTAAISAAMSAAYTQKLGVAYSVASAKASYDVLALEPKNAIAGGKLSYHSAAFDASLSYLYDIDPLYTPVFTVTQSGPTSSSVSVSLERERIHRFGADFKTTLGKLGLWAESCYSLTPNSGDSDDYSHRRSKLDYVVGGDATFGAADAGYVNMQYFGTWIPGYDDTFYEDLGAGKITDLAEVYRRAMVESLGLDTEGFLQGASVNIEYELWNGLVTPQATFVGTVPFLYDEKNKSDEDVTRYGSLALNPEIDLKPMDSFHVILGADLSYSWTKVGDAHVSLDEGDKIGSYATSNNVYLKLLYKWNY